MTICDYEQAALDVGAVHYSPAPLRAVKGISFTYDQLIEFSEKLKAAERQKVLTELSQKPTEWYLYLDGTRMWRVFSKQDVEGRVNRGVDTWGAFIPVIRRPEAPQPAAQESGSHPTPFETTPYDEQLAECSKYFKVGEPK